MAGYVFLARNNLQLTAPEPEAAQSVLALAAGELTEEAFANWLRTHTEPR